MTAQSFLLHLLGGVALLLFATRMVRTGIERAFGERLRRVLGAAASNPLRGFTAGVGVAAAMQSSTACSLLLVGFAQRGIVPLPAALAILLGADIGSTLVVQALSFNLRELVPVLLIAGVSAFMMSTSPMPRQIGRIVTGLALMMLALGMIVDAAQPLRESWLTALVLQRFGQEPFVALLVGAALAWLFHSSVATILFVAALAATGVLPATLAASLVLGINIGAGLIPLGLAWGAPMPAKRMLVGNLAFRFVGALVCLPFVHRLPDLLAVFGAEPARLVANLHTAFNLALGVAFLPFVGRAAALLERVMPDPTTPESTTQIAHLDDALLGKPQVALAAAKREVMRLADMVESMLRDTILAFDDPGGTRRDAVKRLDVEVDRLQERIKLYLTRLTRGTLSEEEGRRAFDLIVFTTNLEHVGDIIDKNLLELAAKKRRLSVAFSEEGWAELQAMHERLVDQMRLSLTVFDTGDREMARQLVSAKDDIRAAEKEATLSHLRRLREGAAASIETSALHLDILRDLKRIGAHLTSVAYPILEASGDLSGSRLRPAG